MSFSKSGSQTKDKTLNILGKTTSLNPNAAEFVPFSLRSSPKSAGPVDAFAYSVASELTGKAALDRSESSVSNNSDEEARQYWSHQLPDDITPDFKVTGNEESKGPRSLSLAGLSLQDGNEMTRFTPSAGNGYVMNQQHLSSDRSNRHGLAEMLRYSVPSHGENLSSASFLNSPNRILDEHISIVNDDQLISNGWGRLSYNGNSRHEFVNDTFSEPALVDNIEINPVELLAAQFPGFAADSLMDLYFANKCDLKLTIKMLTQLELQFDGNFSKSPNSKTLTAPNFSALNFPVPSVAEGQNGLQNYAADNLQQSAHPFRSSDRDDMLFLKSRSSFPSRSSIDFASAVKKLASQDSSARIYDRNGSSEVNIGSSRATHLNALTNTYNGIHGRSVFGDEGLSLGSAQAAPLWLETGEAVANMYSELREGARDHALLYQACFEQARQAFLIGNKALAKELSVKGQLHSMKMKAALEKAQESINRQRNPINPETQGGGRGQERLIDLRGLPVNEAIYVLKHELSVLRNVARSGDHHLHVYICVGTGHNTRGSRTSARFPIVVQHFLLEDEGLDYSEPQPGLLRVVIY